MFDKDSHATLVDTWVDEVLKGLPSAPLLEVHHQALAAVWQRAIVTLGDVTMESIAERVLAGGKETYPWFAAITLGADGYNLRNLATASLPEGVLRDGLRSLLLDFLTLIGTLTAEIMSPQLHSELMKVGAIEVPKSDAKISLDPKGRTHEQ